MPEQTAPAGMKSPPPAGAKPFPPPTTALAITKDATVNAVMAKITALQEGRQLKFPPGYSPENALMAAYLVLQTVMTPDKKPVLEVCTKDSITNSLLEMVVQGLTPAKKQIYFIPYALVLTCQRSYFGTTAVVKRVTKAADVYAEVVYEGETFEFEIRGGNTFVTLHKRTLAGIDKTKIVAAYCVIVLPGKDPYTQIMNLAQIHESWKMARPGPFDEKGQIKPGTPHARFPEEMCKRTVLGRTAKLLINSSDDSSLDLLLEVMAASEDRADEAAFALEVKEEASGETIDAEFSDTAPQGAVLRTAASTRDEAPPARNKDLAPDVPF